MPGAKICSLMKILSLPSGRIGLHLAIETTVGIPVRGA